MISWIHPTFCKPPHAVTHPDKYEELMQTFAVSGWDPDESALIGYWFDNYIQLVSGSHRWAAAFQASIKIPVEIKTYEYLAGIWGSDEWLHMLKYPPQAGMSHPYVKMGSVEMIPHTLFGEKY